MHMQQQIEIPRSKTGDVPSSSVETVSLFGFSHPPYFHLVHLDGGVSNSNSYVPLPTKSFYADAKKIDA